MIAGSQAGRGALIAFGGLLCCLVAATPASAGNAGPTVSLGTSKGLQYMKATYLSPIGPLQTSQSVACDGDAEATGGGGSITGPPATSVLNESFPTLPGPTGWVVEGHTTAPTAQRLAGYAICAGVDTTVATVDENIPAGSSFTQAAFCPGEELVTGGGIQAASVGIRIEATYPPELQTDNWFGLAKNTTGGTIDVDNHAVCTSAYTVKYRNSEVVNVQSGKTATATAPCKRREAVLGGGFAAFSEGLPASGGWVSVSRPRDSKRDRKKVPDDGWRATYRNESVVTHRLLVRAVCKAGTAT